MSKLPGGVVYYPAFIEHSEADTFLVALLKLDWHQHTYLRTGPAPRQYAWMGIPYQSPNSVNKVVVTEWTPEARQIKSVAEEKLGCTFDSLNLNLYRNHRDSIAPHSDSEREGLWSFPIASVSLGASRRFTWRGKTGGPATTQLLEHGSLLVMPSGFQRDHVHEVPKQQKPCGPRINLTFRRKVAATQNEKGR